MSKKSRTKRFSRKQIQKRKTRSLRGGAIPKLPILPGQTSEDWNFYYCSGHGSLSENVYKVPERTYILHIAVSGKGCQKVAWFFDNWIYDYETPIVGIRSIKQKLFNSLRDGSFLRAGSINMREYLGNLTISNANNLSNLSLNFYEPDDIVSDLNLQFYNHNLPIFLQGVYEIPIPYTVKQAQFDINRRTGAYKSTANINTLVSTNLGTSITTTPDYPKYHRIYNIPQNLLQSEMFTNNKIYLTLSNAISMLPAVAEGHFRLLIVDACRVAATENNAIRARRMSIAARRKSVSPTESRTRSWFSINWLKKIQTNYNNWYSKQLIKDSHLTILKVGINSIVSNLDAGNTVPKELLLITLENIYIRTGGGVSAGFATLFKFPAKPVAMTPVAATPNVHTSPAGGTTASI